MQLQTFVAPFDGIYEVAERKMLKAVVFNEILNDRQHFRLVVAIIDLFNAFYPQLTKKFWRVSHVRELTHRNSFLQRWPGQIVMRSHQTTLGRAPITSRNQIRIHQNPTLFRNAV